MISYFPQVAAHRGRDTRFHEKVEEFLVRGYPKRDENLEEGLASELSLRDTIRR